MNHRIAYAALLLALPLTGCGRQELDTRTFEVQYLAQREVHDLIQPYVFSDRESGAGTFSTAEGAVTVRETEDNLEKIGRVLEQYDRPRPTVMLHFQIIEADGASDPDPAISEVERELRRLFRFDGYELVADAQVLGIQGTAIRQVLGDPGNARSFVIRGGVTEVRTGGETATVTVDVALSAAQLPDALQTTVTIPVGHAVVLGTANAPSHEGALILVVRAEIVDAPTSPVGPMDSV